MGKLTITGRAEHEYQYDAMEITLNFSVQKSSTADALTAVLGQCEEFLAKVTSEGLSMENIRIENDSTRRNQRYDSGSVSFAAERAIKIRVPFSMDYANYLLSVVSEKGYDAAISTEYLLTNREEIHNELIKEALSDSRKKAELIAQSMGVKVVGIDTATICESRDNIALLRAGAEHERGIASPQSLSLSNQLGSPVTKESETVEAVWIIE